MALSAMNPEDPIRYDFALSRFGEEVIQPRQRSFNNIS